jgi:hypothetical protein
LEEEQEAEQEQEAAARQGRKKGVQTANQTPKKRKSSKTRKLDPDSALKATIAAANGERLAMERADSSDNDSDDGDFTKKYRNTEFETSSSSSSTSGKTKSITSSKTGSTTSSHHHTTSMMRNPQLVIDQATLVAIEKYTFESWINVRLLGRGVFVTDLFTDLRSGVILAHLVECLSGRRISGLNALDKQSTLPPSLAPPLPVTEQAKRAILNASKAARRSVRRARAASLGSVLAATNDPLNTSQNQRNNNNSDSDDSSEGDEFDVSMSTSFNKDMSMFSESGRKLTAQEKREVNKRKSLLRKKNKIEASMNRELERDQLKTGGKDFIREQGDSQMVCFKRMVTVFKFLRVVADAVETNHLDG